MVGRSVCENPFYWRRVDKKFHPNDLPVLVNTHTDAISSASSSSAISRREVLQRYAEYASSIDIRYKGHKSVRMALAKPILALFHGEANGKRFRINVNNLLRGDPLVGTSGVMSLEPELDSTAAAIAIATATATATAADSVAGTVGLGDSKETDKKPKYNQARAKEKAEKRAKREAEVQRKVAALSRAQAMPMGDLLLHAAEVSNLDAAMLDAI